jgi:hypothetical protein
MCKTQYQTCKTVTSQEINSVSEISTNPQKLQHLYFTTERIAHGKAMITLLENNPYKRGIICCQNMAEAKQCQETIRTNGSKLNVEILEGDMMRQVTFVLAQWNDNKVHYIIAPDQGPLWILYKTKANVIINWSTTHSSSYMRRACCSGCSNDVLLYHLLHQNNLLYLNKLNLNVKLL